MKVELIPVLNDNYIHLITADNGELYVVDPAVGEPVADILNSRDKKLSAILNTHHHWDHIGGNKYLKKKYDCKIYAPKSDAHRIPDIDFPLSEGDAVDIGGHKGMTLETPGHTTGHICFYFEKEKVLFAGDTVFSMGCGRLFEGSPEQMWHSLSKIINLPDDTSIYCAHEYTLDNAKFCQTIEPENEDLIARIIEAKALREEGKPTLPTTIGLEKNTNVFFRAGSAEKFAEIREAKDNF
jgi:hydroxyacylglutathione hydrolase